MTEPETTGSLRGAIFHSRDLRGARFAECDLTDVVVRGSAITGIELDDPWLLEGHGPVTINGVDVTAYVDAELDRRFPGRELRRADTPEGLLAAWSALEHQWAQTLARVDQMPDGAVNESVGGEFSFAQTLRHLVLATDMWLGNAVLSYEDPFHPLGLMDTGSAADRGETPDLTEQPSYAVVLAARADRVAMVRDFIAAATPELLAEQRPNPHAPEHSETVLSCVHTILEEEWEHHRYAVRDLDAMEGQP